MPRLRLGRLATVALLLALPAAPVAAQYSVTYGQGDFGSLDRWTEINTLKSTGVTYTNSSVTNGGNDGSYWQHDVGLPEGRLERGIRSFWINEDYRWNLTDHLLASLGVSIDTKVISSTFSSRVAGFLVPVIRQNGTVFLYRDESGPRTIGIDGADWTTLSWFTTDFSSASWQAHGALGTTLDMSSSGGDLFFGFRFSLVQICPEGLLCSGQSTQSGLDNLSFTARAVPTEVPEPSTWLLLVAAAPLFLRARAHGRRRA